MTSTLTEEDRRLILDLISTAVGESVPAAIAAAPQLKMSPGTFRGTNPENGFGIVTLDSGNPDDINGTQCSVIGPHPNAGARVAVLLVPPMSAFVMGEVVLRQADPELYSRMLLDQPNGTVGFYDATGQQIGEVGPMRFYAGDPEDGARVQLDPYGGLRVYNGDGHMTGIHDSSGVQVRDPEIGLVHVHLAEHQSTWTSQHGNKVTIIPEQDGNLFAPKWVGTTEVLPGTTHDTPAVVPFTAADFELRYAASYYFDAAVNWTYTPPAGYTEQVDESDPANGQSRLAVTLASKQPQTANAVRTFTASSGTISAAIGQSVVVRANPTGPAPSIRSISKAFSTFQGTNEVVVSLPPPAGVADGDLLLAFVTMGNDGGFVPASWLVPAGWNFLGAHFGANATNDLTLAGGCWWKQATASEPPSYEVPITILGPAPSTKVFHGMVVAIQDAGQQQGGADIVFEPPSRCRVWSSIATGPLPVGPGNNTPIQFHATSFDPGDNYEPGLLFEYTCPQSGPYIYGWQVVIIGTAGERFATHMTRDPTGVQEVLTFGSDIILPNANPAFLTGFDNRNLNEGDKLQPRIVQINGTGRTTSVGENLSFFFIQRGLST